jgi:hypothetical protein
VSFVPFISFAAIYLYLQYINITANEVRKIVRNMFRKHVSYLTFLLLFWVTVGQSTEYYVAASLLTNSYGLANAKNCWKTQGRMIKLDNMQRSRSEESFSSLEDKRDVHFAKRVGTPHSLLRYATGWTVRCSKHDGGERFSLYTPRPALELLYNGDRRSFNRREG